VPKHHAMKAYKKREGKNPSILDVGVWSASCFCCLPPEKKTSGINWIGGWRVPRTKKLTIVAKRKISPRLESNSGNPDSILAVY
jgi:hypothetical protein